MSEFFDPKSTARSIEEVGNALLHGKNNLSYADVLERTGDLNPSQVKDLSSQIWRDNLKPNGMPSVDLSVGVDGQISGITFKPALSDIMPSISPSIKVETGHQDTGVAPPVYTPSHGHHKPLVQGG